MADNHMNDHLWEQRYENAVFLTETAKLHPERAARRLGMTLQAFDKMMERGRAKSDSGAVPRTGSRQGSV